MSDKVLDSIPSFCSGIDFRNYESPFINKVKQFVSKEVSPFTREWEQNKLFPEEIWTKLGQNGLLSMTIDPNSDEEPSCLDYVLACKEIAKGDPALSMNVAAVNALCIPHIAKLGSNEQREKYLEKAMKGELKLAWALTEPDAGSDARRVKTLATPIEDKPGYFHLNGQKMFITNGGPSDLMIVIARTSEKELSAFLMESNQPGIKDKERIHTIGVQASYTTSFKLDNAIAWHTPCSFEQAISFLGRGRLGIAGMALGIAEKAFELMVEYSKQREQFNRKLSDMQSVQNMIADSSMELEAARLLLIKGACLYDCKEDVTEAASMAKLYASETANRITNRAIQVHGGRGMTFDYLVEKLWRDAKLTEIGEGCSEIQRLIISKIALKK